MDAKERVIVARKVFIFLSVVILMFFLASCVDDTLTSTGGASNHKTDNCTVYITDTGNKYHESGCKYLAKSKHSITLREAKERGYTPCSVCDPPTSCP